MIELHEVSGGTSAKGHFGVLGIGLASLSVAVMMFSYSVEFTDRGIKSGGFFQSELNASWDEISSVAIVRGSGKGNPEVLGISADSGFAELLNWRQLELEEQQQLREILQRHGKVLQ